MSVKGNFKKVEKMNFRDYFNSVKNESPRVELRNKILEETGMAYSTFYQKLNSNSFDKLEMEKISSILSMPLNELFPENL